MSERGEVTRRKRVTKAQVAKAWKAYCKNPSIRMSNAHQKLLKAYKESR